MDINQFRKNIFDNGRCTKRGISGDVNIKVHGYGIGGSLTILFNWLALFGDNVGNIYVDLSDDWKKWVGMDKNIFDLILDQKKIDGANEITIYGHHLINFNDETLTHIRHIIHKKIKIKKEIIEKLNNSLLNNNILDINSLCGVHIRLTDMKYHKNVYGDVTFDTYINEIEKLNNNINFFIASDNNESLEKIKTLYGSRINYIVNPDRIDKETNCGEIIIAKDNRKAFDLGIKRLDTDEKIVNDFIDLLALSKCNKLIGMKFSIYKIAALLLSNTITENNNIELPLSF